VQTQIDPNDQKLNALKEAFGEKVYNSVATALLEIEEYNASGRYPVSIPWISEENRPATLTEIVAYQGEIIQALMLPIAPRKRPRV
jgi:hypothetical protein